MLNSLVSFCFKCGKKLDNKEIIEGIELKRKGLCIECYKKEGLNGSGNDNEIKSNI